MVGGGYSFAEPPLEAGNPLIVEASYPLDARTWRVIVTRPEAFDQDRDGIPLATSWVTCVAFPDDVLQTRIVASSLAMATAGSTTENATASADCPEGAVLTGGGFSVTPAADDRWEVAGLYNAWTWESVPTADGSWEATLHRIRGQQGPTPPSLRAYSVCAETLIDTSHVVEASAEKRMPINYVYWDGAAVCTNGEVASGGGYAFVGDPLVPHLVADTSPEVLEGAWVVAAINGHQVGSSAGVDLKAVCVVLPTIVDVVITSPRGEICRDCTTPIEQPVRVGLDPADPSMSEPIDFAAQATDGSGDPLTGGALVWRMYMDPSTSGTEIGTGESFSARLPAPPAGQTLTGYLIEVVATEGSGVSASDTVFVIVDTS